MGVEPSHLLLVTVALRRAGTTNVFKDFRSHRAITNVISVEVLDGRFTLSSAPDGKGRCDNIVWVKLDLVTAQVSAFYFSAPF